MAKIAIIGYGNVGFHFSKALSYRHHVSIYSKSNHGEVNELDSFKPEGYDFILITVSDDAIKTISDSFRTHSATVIHTSGSRPISDLDHHAKRGVIYPLQTFSREKPVDFAHLSLFLESTPKEEAKVLELAECISSHYKITSSENRAKIHLAAVFACNFSNHMYHIADRLLYEAGLELKDVQLLIEETTLKAFELTPKAAQTGPAIRKDVSTLALHEKLLEDDDLKELYRLLSQSIQKYS